MDGVCSIAGSLPFAGRLSDAADGIRKAIDEVLLGQYNRYDGVTRCTNPNIYIYTMYCQLLQFSAGTYCTLNTSAILRLPPSHKNTLSCCFRPECMDTCVVLSNGGTNAPFLLQLDDTVQEFNDLCGR